MRMQGIVANNLLSFIMGAAWLLLMPALAVAQSDAQTKSGVARFADGRMTVVTASRVKELLKTAPYASRSSRRRKSRRRPADPGRGIERYPRHRCQSVRRHGGAEYLYMRGQQRQ